MMSRIDTQIAGSERLNAALKPKVSQATPEPDIKAALNIRADAYYSSNILEHTRYG
jgi:hypothetical protein